MGLKIFDEDILIDYSNKHKYPGNFLTYGTAGFRTKAHELDHVMFRMGILAVLYANFTKKTSGIMITASHNPEEDNGIKIIGNNGEMLVESWEKIAIELANCNNSSVIQNVKDILKNIDGNTKSLSYYTVFIAHDTRKSSPGLVNACIDGIEAIGGSFINYGLMTTPQLHYMVSLANHNKLVQDDGMLLKPIHEAFPTEREYFDKLILSFDKFLWTCHKPFVSTTHKHGEGRQKKVVLTIDAANGVGAIKMRQLAHLMKEKCVTDLPLPLEIVIANDHVPKEFEQENDLNEGINSSCENGDKHCTDKDGFIDYRNKPTIDRKHQTFGLNEKCGADYVKVNMKPPHGICPCKSTVDHEYQFASFDGDADRIVFFYFDKNGIFRLLDGDKMALLIAHFIRDVLRLCLIDDNEFKLGVVQTAYANGSSTQYIKEYLNMKVYITPTGVKHLHHQASQLDIGIYFEANGHGTILYSDKFVEKMKTLSKDETQSMETKNAALSMLYFIDLTNQSVGDALADLLLIEAILLKYQWSIETWDAMYMDLPNRQLKLKIKDRSLIKTSLDETECISPSQLQNEIDTLISQFGHKARSFIRPSGTEDIVRVYAEADTQINADELAIAVCSVAYELTGGIGDKPSVSK